MDFEHRVAWKNRHCLAIVSHEDGVKLNPLLRAALVTAVVLSIIAAMNFVYAGGLREVGKAVWVEFPDFIKDFIAMSGGIWSMLNSTWKGVVVGAIFAGAGCIIIHALYAPKVIAIKEGDYRTIKAGSFSGQGNFVPAVWRRVDYSDMNKPTEIERNSAKVDISAKNEEGWAPIYEYQTEAQHYSVSIRVAVAAIPYALFRVVYELFLFIAKVCIFAYDHLTGQEKKRWTVGQIIMEIPYTIINIIKAPCYGTALLIGSIYSFFDPENGQKLTATIESQWNYSFKEGASIPTNRSCSMCVLFGHAIWGNYLQPCRQILAWVQLGANNEILNVTDSSGTRPLALALREDRDSLSPDTICDKKGRTYKVYENSDRRADYALGKMNVKNAEIARFNAQGRAFDIVHVIYSIVAILFATFAIYSFYQAVTLDASYVVDGTFGSVITLLVLRLLYNEWQPQEGEPLQPFPEPPRVVRRGKSFGPADPLFSDPFPVMAEPEAG